MAVLAVSVAVSAACAGVNSGRLSLWPPHLNHSSGLETAAATTHVIVDFPAPSIVYRRTELLNLVDRAQLAARMMSTDPVLALIARRAGIRPSQLSAITRTTANVPSSLTDPGSEQRAAEIVKSYAPYRIEVQGRPSLPVIDIYTQAPTVEAAQRLGNVSFLGLQDYLRQIAAQQGLPPSQMLVFKPLGDARGTPINTKAPIIIALLTFVVVFALCLATALLVLWLRLPRASRPVRPPEPPLPDPWPHTRRVLPWMVAGFIAMIWLVPFNQIKLKWSGPIDLQLDRLVLPVIVIVWIFALVAGGEGAPRLRFTRVHAALAVFVGLAFFSDVLDGRYISHVLELDLAVKQLPVLVSYAVVFLIVSSVIRPAEVRPLLKLSVLLSLITAAGVIYESRTQVNIFYSIFGKLLPAGLFDIQSAGDGIRDSIGRLEIHGPAEPGVEAAVMLSMALPIAIVFLLESKSRRDRTLWALAAVLILAGTFATGRKSALIAPISVLLTLAYFRRRELLKLAPLGLVLIGLMPVAAPGTIHNLVGQFVRPDAATVPTTSDRTSDYDALRPDVWSHLAFGRGWGTYNHESYRILDSEILHNLVEVGVLGLLAYVAVMLSVVLISRRTISQRDPRWAPPSLIGTCSAVCFLTASTLFDSLAFPHGTDVFLYMAALVVVVQTRGPQRGPAPKGVAPARTPARRGAPALHSSPFRPGRPVTPALPRAQAGVLPPRWSKEAWDSASD